MPVRLRCVEAGARGVAVWPHPRVSGCVGCRYCDVYCDVSVPGDGRGSCGRALGRGMRPALNPLLKRTCLGETSHPRPAAVRAPTGR